MITSTEIQTEITAFLKKRIGEEQIIKNDEDIFKAGYVNSLFALELVTFLEQNFKITIENEDLDLKNFNSIQNLNDFVCRKKALL